MKAKINNAGVIALGDDSNSVCNVHMFYMCHAGYTQTLRPGVKASFGLALDTQKLNEVSPAGPSHKVRPPTYEVFIFVIESLSP